MKTPATAQLRYYEFVMVAFVVILVCSNLIGPAKIAQVDLPFTPPWSDSAAIVFGAGVLFFPISYVFGDVLTEVYGYARSRRVIWAGFAALGFASFMAWVVVALPPAPFWKNQEAYEVAFGNAWRVSLASMIAYFCGEFVNSFTLAFWGTGIIPDEALPKVMAAQFVAKVLVEVLFTPVTYALVGWLKRAEGVDHYDRDTKFTPFSLRV